MLYTFSQAHYSQTELEHYLLNATAQDAVVLWQDGVLLALKQADMLARCHASCFALENDILAIFKKFARAVLFHHIPVSH